MSAAICVCVVGGSVGACARADPDHANDRSGCTAVTLLVTKDNRLFCANAGDSRCVLSRRGAAIPLSFDHKPDNEGACRLLRAYAAAASTDVRRRPTHSRLCCAPLHTNQSRRRASSGQVATSTADVSTVTACAPALPSSSCRCLLTSRSSPFARLCMADRPAQATWRCPVQSATLRSKQTQRCPPRSRWSPVRVAGEMSGVG